MPVERLAPDAILAQVNLAGAVTDIDDDPDAPDALWLTASGNNVNTDVRTSFPTPTGTPRVGADLQEFRAQVRQFDTGQTGTPTARIELWEDGLLVRAGPETDVTGAGQVIAFTWNANELGTVDGSLVECKLVGSKSGGSPGTRNTVEVGAVEWNADYSAGGVVSFDGVCNTVTTGAGDLAVIRALDGAGDTLTIGDAALAVKRALDALGGTVTTGAGSLGVKRALDATGDTLSGGSASLDRRPGLDGSAATVTTGAASLNRRVALSGTCATVTTGAAELTISGRVALDGICATQSGGAGILQVKRRLAGAVAVVTTGAAELDRRPGFAGVVPTLSGAAANFNIRRGLDGQIQVITGGSASLACRRSLAGTCTVLTTGAGELSVVQTVASFPIGTVLVLPAIIAEVSAMEAVSLAQIEARRAVSGEATAFPAVSAIIDVRVQG